MVAAAAARLHPTLAAAAAAMHQPGTTRAPRPQASYERDWAAFRALRRGGPPGAP
jgi:ribulose kinase